MYQKYVYVYNFEKRSMFIKFFTCDENEKKLFIQNLLSNKKFEINDVFVEQTTFQFKFYFFKLIKIFKIEHITTTSRFAKRFQILI